MSRQILKHENRNSNNSTLPEKEMVIEGKKNISMRTIGKIFIAAAMFVFLFNSCSDFLDKQPQGNLTQNDFPVTADQALLATNACYRTLRNWYFHYGGYPILDIM